MHLTNIGSIRAITFDAAGTLLLPHPSVSAVYREVALRHGRDFDPTALDRAFHDAFGRVSKSSVLHDGEAREREFWRQIVTATVLACGSPPADFDAFFDDLWEVFARGDSWRVVPDAQFTLHTLRGRGYQLAVLSNWDRRLHRVLAETGLQPRFDHVLISSEVGADKPDVAIFRAAERTLDAAPAQCLHVGDSHWHDFDGARAAGWNALLLRRNDTTDGSDHIVNQLSDLVGLLPECASGGKSPKVRGDVLR